MLFDKDLAGRCVRFVIVGGAAALGYFAVAQLAIAVFHSVPLSSAIGYLCMLPFSFMGHKNWTFRSKGPARREMARFALVSFLAMLISAYTPALAMRRWHLNASASLLVTCFVVPAFTFLAMQCWVFMTGRLAGESQP